MAGGWAGTTWGEGSEELELLNLVWDSRANRLLSFKFSDIRELALNEDELRRIRSDEIYIDAQRLLGPNLKQHLNYPLNWGFVDVASLQTDDESVNFAVKFATKYLYLGMGFEFNGSPVTNKGMVKLKLHLSKLRLKNNWEDWIGTKLAAGSQDPALPGN